MRCDRKERRQKKRSDGDGVRAGIFMGGTLILAGTAFLLSRLDMLGGMEAWQLWPLLLVMMGLCQFSQKNIIPGLLFTAVGVLVQLHYFGVIQLAWGVIWPVLIILLGLIVFITSVGRTRRKKRTPTSADYFESNVVLGGQQDEVTSKAFQGGDISCLMGGLELNLKEAVLKDGEATLRVKIVIGGLELKVPEEWTVIVKGNPVMGAFENKTRSSMADEDNPQRLIIEGSVFMGGVEIKN